MIGTYVLQSRAGKTAWNYAVDGLMENNPGLTREEAEKYLHSRNVDENKPETILYFTLKEDGTIESGGYLYENTGTWSLKGNTVKFQFGEEKAEATYKKGKISTKFDNGEIAVYKKSD